MSQELFLFVKSFDDRFEEFNNTLNSGLKATDVKKEWSNFLELTIEPVGWRAIWKISRDLCCDMKIDFPCTVIVIVQKMNFQELTCTVAITEVEEMNMCLPPMITDIPLIELYPTINQDNTCVLPRIYETARIIDSLRFFYNHLWMPWDYDYEEEYSWVISHLEGRLRLHFAMLERKVSHEVAYAVRKIVTEGKRIQKEIDDIEEEVSEEMEVEGSSSRLLELTELHNRMATLRNEFKIYEKPELLKAFLHRVHGIEKSQLDEECCESVIFMVLRKSTPEQLGKLAKLASESKLIRLFQVLQEALVKAPATASVWVGQGKHPLHDLGNLEVGGSIRGVEPGAVLTEEAESPCGWILLRGSLTLTSLTINMTSVWNIIKVRPEAECVLQEVRLEGTTVTDAVVVFPGAKLVANNCHFSNCCSAVVCDSNSSVVLTNCTFTNNNVAVEVKEGCFFTMQNCTISDSQTYGINVILAAHENKYATDTINSVPGLVESGTTYKNNASDCHFDSSSGRPAENVNSESELLSASR